jgi:hypothetical protein
VAALAKNINLEFDSDTGEYYIVWEPIVTGMGRTKLEALEDLREAAHFGIDTLVDLKLKNLGIGKED